MRTSNFGFFVSPFPDLFAEVLSLCVFMSVIGREKEVAEGGGDRVGVGGGESG